MMGDQLMKRVMRDWGDLPGNAYKCLMVMASCAMDDAKPPIYFGGWQRLAITGLGRRDWPADSDESDEAMKRRRGHEEIVRQAIKELRKPGGPITLKTRGRAGMRAEYVLNLDRLPQQNLGLQPKETQGHSPKVLPANSQETLGPTTNRTNHSQGGNPTSSLSVPHQGRRSLVDKGRSSPGRLEQLRAAMSDGEVA